MSGATQERARAAARELGRRWGLPRRRDALVALGFRGLDVVPSRDRRSWAVQVLVRDLRALQGLPTSLRNVPVLGCIDADAHDTGAISSSPDNYFTDPSDVVLPTSGWTKTGNVWQSNEPLRDRTTGLYARATYRGGKDALARLGLRLPTRDEVIARRSAALAGGVELPVLSLPNQSMRNAAGENPRLSAEENQRKEAALLKSGIQTFAWAELLDQEIADAARRAGWDGKSILSNAGKMWIGAGPSDTPVGRGRARLMGWWDGQKWLQSGYGVIVDPDGNRIVDSNHDEEHHDYGTLLYAVSETDPALRPSDTGDVGAVDDEYVTAPEDFEVKPSGWQKVGTAWQSVEPLVDRTRGLYARPTYAGAKEGLARRGFRLPTRAEVIARRLVALAHGVELPYFSLPDSDQIAAAGIARSSFPVGPEGDAAYKRRLQELLDAGLKTLGWAQHFDDRARTYLAEKKWDGTGIVSNLGKAWISGAAPGRARLMGWWQNGRWIQDGTRDPHADLHHDYATLVYAVSDTDPALGPAPTASKAPASPAPAPAPAPSGAPDLRANPKAPPNYRYMQGSETTPAMAAWAAEVLKDTARYPMFATTTKVFDVKGAPVVVMGKIEWHPPSPRNPTVHRGVSLLRHLWPPPDPQAEDINPATGKVWDVDPASIPSGGDADPPAPNRPSAPLPGEAPALVALRDALNQRFPGRRESAGQILASRAHQDHNPSTDHGKGNALDVFTDFARGPNLDELSDALMADPRVQYVIWRRRIANATPSTTGTDRWAAGEWRAYPTAYMVAHGSKNNDPHEDHLHVSIKDARREDAGPWNLDAVALRTAPWKFGDLTKMSPVPPEVPPSPPAPPDVPDVSARKGISLVGDSLAGGLQNPLLALAQHAHVPFASTYRVSTSTPDWLTGTLAPELDRVLAHKPAVVLVSLGANELGNGASAGHRTGALMDKILASGAKVAWLAPPKMPTDGEAFRESLAEEVGKRPDAQLLDAQWFSLPRRDTIHPTPEGYETWVEAIARWLPLTTYAAPEVQPEPPAPSPPRGGGGLPETLVVAGVARPMPLEEYIARVVTGEQPAGKGEAAMEGRRALAIAARTYLAHAMALSPKLGTQAKPIPNSTDFQVLSMGPIDPLALRAANDTAGWLIVHDGRIIIANYQAGSVWPLGARSGKEAVKVAPTEKNITYNEGRSGADVIKAPAKIGGTSDDNRGALSQNGAYELARQGWKALPILRFFYGADIGLVGPERCAPTPSPEAEPVPDCPRPVSRAPVPPPMRPSAPPPAAEASAGPLLLALLVGGLLSMGSGKA